MTKDELKYRCQNGYFNQSLLIVCRLIFNYFHGNETISFCIPAFSNLTESPMAKNIFDNIAENDQKTMIQCLN